MKTYKNLWTQFITKENFELAYRNSIKNKSNQCQIRRFNENKEENLEKIRQMVIAGEFHTSPYKTKIVYEPKERVIYKLPYNPDRIVQHAIMNILKPILTNLFIENTFACIEGRGQHKASLKCSEYVRKNAYCLKCDIRKFYPSINQKILSDKYHRIIKDDKFMAVLDDIIFSFEGDYNCPIGNYISQWSGNFYLSSLDNMILHELKPRGYQRFCDDFLLFDNDKSFLHECRFIIGDYIRNELDLEFSQSDVFSVKQGVDFCGYRHFGDYVLVRKSTALRMKRRFRKVEKQLESDILTTSDIDKIRGQIASADGWLKHACSHHLYDSMGIDNLKKLLAEREQNIIAEN